MNLTMNHNGVRTFSRACLLVGLAAGSLGLTGGRSVAAPYSVSFDGVNDYITFGAAAGLGDSNFTVECWFRREGTGVSVSTGTGGVTAFPLVTKGRGETDGNNKDMNYFLGIRASDNVLVADFEEGAGAASPGLNHPVAGVTPVAMGTWYHAAVSYDGTNLCLFLNGCLETNVVIGQRPRWDSIQHAAIGSALTSSGAAAGFFRGTIDKVRIWKIPRSGEQIIENMERDSFFAAGMAGCWSLDNGSGSLATDSCGSGINGTLLNGAAWVAGTPALKALGIGGFMPAAVTCPNQPSQAVDFGGTNPNAIGNFLNIEEASGTDGPTAYQLSEFTLECWFRRDGRGVTNHTGGLAEAVPLISKGGGADQVDGVPGQDMNYFLGIALVNNQWVIGADFEDDAGGNHPITGVTPIENNVWYHAAATYDGSTWAIYLNGLLENSVADGAWCQNLSTRRAAIATARDARVTGPEPNGTRISYFNGAIDEVCIWSHARNQAEINLDLAGGIDPQEGLVGYWKLNGNRSDSSGAFGKNNTLTAGGSAVPYINYNLSPFRPVPLSPADGTTFVGISPGPSLQVEARDPEGNALEVRFYGRAKYAAASPAAYSTYTPGPDFTIVALPDTQYYCAEGTGINGGAPAMFHRQINWILNNRIGSNIVYVTQLGDCAETPTTGEYDLLSAGSSSTEPGFYDLESIAGLPDGIPYGIAVGNHDQELNNDPLGGSTAFYNQYFGIPHFAPRSYFAGHFGRNGADGYSSGQEVNDNHYDLFSASGLDFVVVYLEFNDLAEPIDPNANPVVYQPDAAEAALWEQSLTWADNVLKTYPNRRGIIVSHWIIEHGNPGAFSAPRCATCLSGGLSMGARMYDRLRVNPNLTLMLCGHRSEEGRRVDFYGGNKVHSMLSDYQARAGGGNGWLRMLEFSPSNNVIRVRTYSPHLDPSINSAMPANSRHYEDDADSQFVLDYDLQHTPFKELGSVQLPASSVAQMATLNEVTGLHPGIEYEWYATVSDGCSTNFGPVWKFTTGRYYHYAWVQPQAPYGAAYGMNHNGFSVGRSQQQAAPSIAVEWDNAEFSANLVTAFQDPFFSSWIGTGINDGRDIVGYGLLASGGQPKAFVWIPAIPEWDSLGTPPSIAWAINNAGVVAGYSTVSGLPQACKWGPFPNVATVVIGPLPSDSFSEARDINHRPVGQAHIVGSSTGPTAITRGFVYDESAGGPPVALPALDRNTGSRALGVNDNGVVVGDSFALANSSRAIRWSKVGSAYQGIELSAPAGSPPGTLTVANKIANDGVIVGTAYNNAWMSDIGNNSRAVIWFDNVGYYLDALTYPDYGYLHFNSAVDLTESGRILSIKLQGGEENQAIIVWP